MLSVSLLIAVVAAAASSPSTSSASAVPQSLSLSSLSAAVCSNPTAVSALLALLSVSIAINGYYALLARQSAAASAAPPNMASTDDASASASGSASASALPPALQPSSSASFSSSSPPSSGYKHFGAKQRMKMVLCVRNDLGMGKGKMCGQPTSIAPHRTQTHTAQHNTTQPSGNSVPQRSRRNEHNNVSCCASTTTCCLRLTHTASRHFTYLDTNCLTASSVSLCLLLYAGLSSVLPRRCGSGGRDAAGGRRAAD